MDRAARFVKPMMLREPPALGSKAPGDLAALLREYRRDDDVIVVSFARVGDPSLPLPIVEPLPGRARSGIVAIRPEPNGESPPDATYTFDGLPEGESMTIEFDLRIPDLKGTVGNVVQVYDGAEVARASGDRIETEVR